MKDMTVTYAMQLIGLHRFHIERTKRIAQSGKVSEQMWTVLGGLTPPALGIALDSLGPDVADALNDEIQFFENRGQKLDVLGVPTPVRDKYIPYVKARTWRYIPFLGRDVFWTVGQGVEWEAKKRKKAAAGSGPIKRRRAPKRRSPRKRR